MRYCIKYMNMQSVTRGLNQSVNIFSVREAGDPCLQVLVVGE